MAFKERYEALCKRLDKRLREPGRAGRQRPRYPSQATRSLEEIYIGPDGLITPLGRQAARETAQDLAPATPDIATVKLGLGPVVVGDVLRRHGLLHSVPPPLGGALLVTLDDLQAEAAKRDSDFARLVMAWRDLPPPVGTPLLLPQWIRLGRESWRRVSSMKH